MNINTKNPERILKVSNSDFNQNWQNKRQNPMVHDDDAVLQAINNIIFLGQNEIYYGSGNELALENSIFEPIEFMGDDDALADIKVKLNALDPRIVLIVKASSIIATGEGEFTMNLSFQIENRKRTLTRRIQLK